jgi:hypothetical protein
MATMGMPRKISKAILAETIQEGAVGNKSQLHMAPTKIWRANISEPSFISLVSGGLNMSSAMQKIYHSFSCRANHERNS